MEVDPSPPATVMDKMNDDTLAIIFGYLPFKDKVSCEGVCVTWRAVASRLIKSQKALGNAPTNLSLADHCRDKKHWVSTLDCIPKWTLTNLSILPKILKKCPELKALAITKLREPSFFDKNAEAAAMPKSEKEYRTMMMNNCFGPDAHHSAMEVEEQMSVFFHGADPEAGPSSADDFDTLMTRRHHQCFYVKRGKQVDKAKPSSQGKATKKEKKVEVRPSSIEDFLDIVAKYCPKLECIDIHGLKMTRGYKADQEDGGVWQSLINSCPKLAHLKTYQLYDREFAAIIQKVPLTDISVVYGLAGLNLDTVGPTFRKMCIATVRESGLIKLSMAQNLKAFRELFLVSVNKNMLNHASNFVHLDTLNMSLAVANIEADDLFCVAKLVQLKRLYIKRKEEILEKFDRPFTEILTSCVHLESIRLTNIIIGDTSLRNVQFYNPDLRSLRIELTTGKTNVSLSDRSLYALSELKFLERIKIDYPNTFTETSLIDYLFRAYNLKLFQVYCCKELIPIPQIGLAAIRQAGCANRKNTTLTIDLDTPEKMDLGNVKQTMKRCPRNLNYTISSALDHFSTIHPDGRPKEQEEEDFDEHKSFLFETIE